MSTTNETKINQLVKQWPAGAVFTQACLDKKGYDINLMWRYRKGRWVDSVGSGAYKLNGDDIKWQGGLYALQSQLNLPIHAGGRTALESHGAGHYARFYETHVFLFAPPQTKLPQWFVRYNWGPQLFFAASNFLPFDIPLSFTEIEYRDFKLRYSSRERAMMEMLYHVPDKQGFDEAIKIMEGLMTLRPMLVQQLLEECRSIKVKRLFLYMAEKKQLPWFETIDVSKINLGQGNRLIVKGGQLDKKYRITVPKDYGLDG